MDGEGPKRCQDDVDETWPCRLPMLMGMSIDELLANFPMPKPRFRVPMRRGKGNFMTEPKYPESDDRDWSKIAEPAKDAYWKARRDGKNETEALILALIAAMAAADR